MPYIKQEKRIKFEKSLIDLILSVNNAGELNYIISSICKSYLDKKKESYANYNEVIGVLECAKIELYRTKISDYEELKRNENGEVP